MLQIIYYIVFSLTLFYGLYYLVVGLFAFFRPKNFRIKPCLPKNKFAIVVPARNEAGVVGALVESIKNCNYPKDLYEIIVAVNNTTDNTAEVAKKAGATVCMIKEKVKTKGEVLRIVFKEYKKRKDIDAYVIFDADNIIHPDFLSRMNDTLEAGYRVAEGFKDSKNIEENWISGSYSLFYYMQNFFLNKANMTLGGTANINGTGFMISKKKIDKDGFDTKTITEDNEYTAQCALSGEPVAFVEDAITYDEQPTSFGVSWKQRKRWSVGIIQCMRIYNIRLWKHFLKTGSLSSFGMSMNFISPIMQVLCLVEFFVLIIFRVFNIQLYDIFSKMYSSGIFFLFLTYFTGVIMSIFIIKYNRRKARSVIGGIVLFALFILTWVPINFICLFKKDMVWEEIKHKSKSDVSLVQ